MGNKIDITGKRFGKLTVLRENGHDYKKRLMWLCRCDCGKEVNVLGDKLRAGRIKSCGNKKCRLLVKHGHTSHRWQSPTYKTWSSMITRCKSSNHKNFRHYGGRGIKICERWKSFENFLIDMGERPKGKTLDRIDNDGNYCLENCHWVTHKKQCNNTRVNHRLTFNGITMTMAEWAEKTGIKYQTLQGRLRRGWTIERALSVSWKGE